MIVAALIGAALTAQQAPLPQKKWDPTLYSQEITECDRLANHPDDPNKLTPGVGEKKVDLARAVPACEAAVKADPENPRLNYQLGRVYGYSGQGEKAYPYRNKAVAAGYPQAMFVIGYITLHGFNKQPKDVCHGAELIRQSAIANRFAGQIAFTHYALEGTFKDCPIAVDRSQLLSFISAAEKLTAGDFYKETLVERLREDVEALPQ